MSKASILLCATRRSLKDTETEGSHGGVVRRAPHPITTTMWDITKQL